MANANPGLSAAILSALSAGPLSISGLEAALGEKRSAILAALRALRADDSISLVGAKRGAKYAIGTRPAV